MEVLIEVTSPHAVSLVSEFSHKLKGRELKWKRDFEVDSRIALSASSLIKVLFKKPVPGHAQARHWTR